MKLASLLFFIFLFSVVYSAEDEQRTVVPENPEYVTAVIPVFSQKVSFTLPTNWKAVFEDQQNGAYIIEFIPEGENIDYWQNLFTVQGFENIADKTTPIDFLNSIAFHLKEACGENALFDKIGPMNVTGHNAFAVVMGCTRMPNTEGDINENTHSEFGYYLSIQGEKDYYLIHKQIRGEAIDTGKLPINKENAAAFISGFMPIDLCKGGGEEYECDR